MVNFRLHFRAQILKQNGLILPNLTNQILC